MLNTELAPSTQRRLDIYAAATQERPEAIVEEALADWLDTVAVARLEALAEPQRPDNVVSIDQLN